MVPSTTIWAFRSKASIQLVDYSASEDSPGRIPLQGFQIPLENRSTEIALVGDLSLLDFGIVYVDNPFDYDPLCPHQEQPSYCPPVEVRMTGRPSLSSGRRASIATTQGESNSRREDRKHFS